MNDDTCFYMATQNDLDITAGKIYRVFISPHSGRLLFIDDDDCSRHLDDHINSNSFMIEVEDSHVKNSDELSTTNPFLKTVTKTRITTNYHNFPNGLDLCVTPVSKNISLQLEEGTWDKQSLAELARILNEISETM